MTVPTRAPAPRLQGTRRRGERHEATADLLDARLYPESNRELLNGRFYYGWVVVGVTFVALLVSAGVRSAPGVLVHPLEVDLGWSRAAISVAVSLGLLCHGLAAPFGGWLADRLGPRLLLLVGLALVGVSTLASTAMTELWHLQVLWGVVSGAGTGLAATALGATVATRWFVARRGLVLGLFGAAASAGQLALVPGLMALIVVLGWRGAMVALAAVALAAVVPVLLFMRDDPSDLGLRPYGATAPGGTTGPSQGTPRTLSVGPGAGGASHGAVMGHAVRTPDFWLLAGSFFVCGATSTGLIGTHFVPHSIDHGIPEVTAAGTLALLGAMNFGGTLASGWLTDRCDPRRLLAVYYTLRGAALFVLPFVTDVAGLTVFAVVFGLDYIATVPPTAALAADLFGRRSVGAVFGWVFLSHQVGAAAAAALGGLARVVFGDYHLAFLAAGVVAVMGGVTALCVGRRAPRLPPAAAPA